MRARIKTIDCRHTVHYVSTAHQTLHLKKKKEKIFASELDVVQPHIPHLCMLFSFRTMKSANERAYIAISCVKQ